MEQQQHHQPDVVSQTKQKPAASVVSSYSNQDKACDCRVTGKHEYEESTQKYRCDENIIPCTVNVAQQIVLPEEEPTGLIYATGEWSVTLVGWLVYHISGYQEPCIILYARLAIEYDKYFEPDGQFLS